jgi:hypothetical protein
MMILMGVILYKSPNLMHQRAADRTTKQMTLGTVTAAHQDVPLCHKQNPSLWDMMRMSKGHILSLHES